MASAKAYAPQDPIIGVSVQEMLGEAVEVIIGVFYHPQLGSVGQAELWLKGSSAEAR